MQGHGRGQPCEDTGRGQPCNDTGRGQLSTGQGEEASQEPALPTPGSRIPASRTGRERRPVVYTVLSLAVFMAAQLRQALTEPLSCSPTDQKWP